MLRSLAATVVLLTFASAVQAGNARTNRTEWHYRRWVIQQQHLNRQWAEHFQKLRQDQQRAWQSNPDISTRTYQWQQNRRLQQRQIQQQYQQLYQRAWRR